jgi:hypothetical protein
VNKIVVNSEEGIQEKVFGRRCSEGEVRKYVMDANQGPL